MRICVPTTDGKGLDSHASSDFGDAPYFTLIDSETGQAESILNEPRDHRDGAHNPMEAIQGKDIDAVLCKEMGARALGLLLAEGTRVFVGEGETVREMVNYFQSRQSREISPEIAHGRPHRE